LVELCKSYGKAAPVHALRGVSLEIRQGERVALLGKSGSGKSTLLNLLGALDQPTSGRVEVYGRELGHLRRRELARYRLRTVGMIFQAFNLIPSRTALQNVEIPMIFAGRPPRERQEAARAALEAVGLGARLHHRPAELSGGEHQRVAIARALVNRPALLLADEPTGNLDSTTAGEIIELLVTHVKQHGTTLVLVTHEEELARQATDRILRLKDGQLVS
jgi:ABC-type lipoprotein export system ATPase subunit